MNPERKTIYQKTSHFFDKLEDRVRASLSRRPIIYSMIGGVAVVLFWRGIWMLADEIGLSSINSLIISVTIMLMTGLFVSFFVGDQILISGLKKDKKMFEKTEEEIKEESSTLTQVKDELKKIEKEIVTIGDKV